MSTPPRHTLTSRVADLEAWRNRQDGASDARRRYADAALRMFPVALALASLLVTAWRST